MADEDVVAQVPRLGFSDFSVIRRKRDGRERGIKGHEGRKGFWV